MQNNIIKSFSIQEIVNTISREDFNAFLNKFLSTTNIEKMNEILNILYTEVKNEASKIKKETNYKNAYHYMMLLLYNEAISIDHAIEKLKTAPSFFKEYYTKLCGFGLKEGNPIKGNAIYREYFVRDYIVNIYRHRSDILSYKDVDNIKEEFSRIWNLFKPEEKTAVKTLISIINDKTIEGNACPEDFYKFFVRINDESADCEKNIELLSYILNKDSYSLDRSDIAFIPDGYIEDGGDNDNSIKSSVLLSLLLKIKETTINY